MDTARTALQVGLLVFFAAVLFIIGYYFFFGAVHSEKFYPITAEFSDAQGIVQGADVDLAGVKIGEVSGVELGPNDKAMVRMRIMRNKRIPRASVVTISSSLLGGNATVTISPPGPALAKEYGNYLPGDVIQGSQPFSLASIESESGPLLTQLTTTMKKADLLIAEATKTTSSINRLVASPKVQHSLDDTMNNLDLASRQGLVLTRQMQAMLAEDNGEAKVALGNIDATTGQFRDVSVENRVKLDHIIAHMDHTSASLDHMMAQMDQAFAQGRVPANLADTVANLKQATEQLNQIEADVHSITGNAQVQSDLKTTVHNVAETSGSTSQLVQRLNALTSGHLGASGKGALQFEGRLDFSQNFRTSKFRTDFDLYAPLSSVDFARIGVYDLTERNLLNLQYGLRPAYNSRVDYRAGVYAGKVAIGADYDLFGPDTFSLDLYNPNRLSLDAREHIPLTAQTGLWLGVDDIPRTNALTLGLELRR